MENSLFQYILSPDQLRIFPDAVLQLINLSAKQSEANEDLAKTLDKSSSAKLLNIINSSFFSTPHKLENIQQAIAFCDPSSLRNIAICMLMRDTVSLAGQEEADLRDHWQHALFCAVLAKGISIQVKFPFSEEAFLIGYLHDVGKLVLLKALGKKYEILLEVSKSAPELLLVSESYLGATHSQLGAWLLRQWNFPSRLTDPILFHHEPKNVIMNATPLVKITFVANALCHHLNGNGEESHLVAEEVIGLKTSMLHDLLNRSNEKATELSRLMETQIGLSDLDQGGPHGSPAISRELVHEVNNPLAIIKNYLKILSKKLSSQKIGHEEIIIIDEEIDRVSRIIRGTNEPGMDAAERQKPVDVNALLMDLIIITRDSMKESGVEVLLDMDPSLPAVMADKDGLKQVFINLMTNAVEAMEGGGKLRIRTKFASGSALGYPSGKEELNKNWVEIVFTDDGPGVPHQLRDKLFKRSVTSKGDNHSGLGLSICQRIVQAMNGRIMYEVGEQKGSVFKIQLPL